MQDDFKRFRYAVGDAIFDSCKVASSVAVITKLAATLRERLPTFAAAEGYTGAGARATGAARAAHAMDVARMGADSEWPCG